MRISGNKTRPQILTYLCTGSLISGVAMEIMLIALILSSFSGKISSGNFPGIAIQYLEQGYLFVLILILLTGVGIAGVILMLKMEKTGFYLYAVVKATIYFLPVVCIGNNQLHYPGLAITSVLIVTYGIIFTTNSKAV